MILFLLGVGCGIVPAMLWHWWCFAHYDAWILDNGGKLPPPGTP